jgi:hypothetical protein
VHESPPFYFFVSVLLSIIAKTDKVCVKFSFLTGTLSFLCYDDGRKSERVRKMSHVKKAVAQAMLLVVGIAMLCFGVWRGEAATVLSKAIKLCLECVGIG